jgi:thiol:disulfide interchange protein/DsbC/DsbD-like thiol-disulfide interchange protein
MLARFLLLAAALLAGPAFAQSSAQLEHTRVELVSEVATPAPGQRFTIGVVMKPNPGWHTYWEHPGDSGMPTAAKWALPPRASASAFRYPVPETYVVAGLMNHVFSHENVLLAEIDVPQGARGELPLKVRLDWLVCDDKLCVPEGADLSLPLTIGDGSADPAQQARFAAARAALPRQLMEQAHFQTNGKRIRISVPMADPENVTGAHFFATADDAMLFASPQIVSRTENALIIETDAVPGMTPAKVPGLLRVERSGDVLGLTLTAAPGTVPAGQPLAGGATASGPAFLPAFGLAVLGGLLLNLMPCVFPILSLKALSLAKSGHSETAARSEGLAYAGGVILITTLLGLAAILIARAGAGAGWAFQLQDPRVILFLMLLTFAIGLNFAGLFEVQLGAANAGSALAAKPGAKGAFFTGALAAFVATPCTGPFMAGALGAALVLPPLAGLAVFAGLGLGLALPFLAIGFVPALRRRLPKPGAWMQSFRRILAVPMLLTALGLAWVLGRQAGTEGLIAGLGAALAFALALWVLGLRQEQQRSSAVPLALAAMVAIGAPLALGSLPAQAATGKATHGPSALNAKPFSAEALKAAQAAHTPTFLYFTADWCLTCKVNEKGALSDPKVAQAFKAAGIQVMVGDWTRPDPAIARFLQERGRAGIPLYLFYGADGQVTELPQLLTADGLTALASPRSPSP